MRTLAEHFAPQLMDGEVLEHAVVGRDARTLFEKSVPLLLLGLPIGRFLYALFGNSDPEQYWLIGVTDRRLVVLEIDNARTKRVIAEPLTHRTWHLSEQPLRLSSTDGTAIDIDPTYADHSVNRAYAIGQRLGDLDRGEAIGTFDLDVLPFAPRRRSRRALAAGVAAILLGWCVWEGVRAYQSRMVIACMSDDDCTSHFCERAIVGPGLCSHPCNTDTDCGNNRCARDGACVPHGSLANGKACRANWECDSTDCDDVGGSLVCTGGKY
jgi:hypothetical protein